MDSAQILKNLARPAATLPTDDVLPTGSPALDVLLGGGWPAGVISELCGPPGPAAQIACRTIAAVQAAYPGSMVISCHAMGDYSTSLAAKYGVRADQLLVTRSPDAAVAALDLDPAPRLAVIDHTVGGALPVRGDKQLSVLYITPRPGDVQSTACIRLTPHQGHRDWAWAERMWHWWNPARLGPDQHPVSLTKSAIVQEMLDLAVTRGIVTVRGRWYSHGRLQIGGGWQEAVSELIEQRELRRTILAEVAAMMPVYPGWDSIYS